MKTFERAQKTIAIAVIKHVLNVHRPKNASELLLNCGLPLKQIDYGQYRNVLEVVGTPYVIKVPSPGRLHNKNVQHSINEFLAWKNLKRYSRYKPIREYLPFFHYFDHVSGIAVMDMYSELKKGDRRFDGDIEAINELLNKCDYKDADVKHSKKDNYGIDSEGNLKILDLGCFV